MMSRMTKKTAALLPLKDFVNAKQRLAGVLAPHERRALFHAMVEDVLSALTAATCIDHVLVISDDPAARLLAQHFGVAFIAERDTGARGLNAVIEAGVARLVAEGFERVLIAHGDLPLLAADDVDAMLQQASVGICIAPDVVNDGSNIMVCCPPQAIGFRYGAGSCAAHQAQAAANGVDCSLWLSPRMAIDIDYPQDLFRFIAADGCIDTSAGKYLQQSSIASRLQAMALAATTISEDQVSVDSWRASS
jgi:2-phospho-L-lactate guanylyltransferase